MSIVGWDSKGNSDALLMEYYGILTIHGILGKMIGI
jgi:hypothetical protein